MSRSSEIEYRTGDQVRLKSGGPLMTVEDVTRADSGDVLVETVWFEPNGDGESWTGPCRDGFDPALLIFGDDV
ncbi:MAG: DUF2158 domain-containing protein [Patescibacteria group bacterium]|nr:DUF2158 domain-containing protein [Patescibacteria group bacterium]